MRRSLFSTKNLRALSNLSQHTVSFINPLNLMKIAPKKSREKLGKSPGTLVYTGSRQEEPVHIEVIDYTPQKVAAFTAKNVEDVFKFKHTKSVTWINITGIHDTSIIQKVGDHFDLHPLLLEDVVNTNQRPNTEAFKDTLFFSLKMIYYDETDKRVQTEQVSLVLGKGFVISFQERAGDVFNPIRERIKTKRVRLSKPDYLCYALIDLIVDNYFLVLENLGDQISSIEEHLMHDPDPSILNVIYGLKRELILIRKFVLPLREVLNNFARTDSTLVFPETKTYIKDVYDHEVQVLDTLDTYRDMLSGLQDLYLSIASNKMNEVMKVLTIIATIFIPLTFIAGIYGMNFEYMPELSYRLSYPIVWGLMLITAGIMLYLFKRRGWL